MFGARRTGAASVASIAGFGITCLSRCAVSPKENALNTNDLNIIALSMSKTSEYGVVGMVVSDPEQAYRILEETRFPVRLTEVVCVEKE